MTAFHPVTENVVDHVNIKLPLTNDTQPLSKNVEISYSSLNLSKGSIALLKLLKAMFSVLA